MALPAPDDMARCEPARHVVGNQLSRHDLQRVCNVCGVSGIELIIIVVAAVVFLGPDKLPELARTVGKLARDLRNATDEFTQAKDEFTRSIDPKKLIGDDGEKPKPRQRPGAGASRDAAAIAAIREEKQKGQAVENPDEVSDASEDYSHHDEAAPEASGSPVEADADQALPRSEDDAPAAFTAPPLDPKYSPEGETEWLRKRLQAAAERRAETMPAPAEEGEDEQPQLPKIRPAKGSIAVGEGESPQDAVPDADEDSASSAKASSTQSTRPSPAEDDSDRSPS